MTNSQFQTIKIQTYLSLAGCSAGFYGCFYISNKIFYPPYLRGCSTNKRFNWAHPMTKYLWCSDRKTGSPACCFNSVPSEQQDRGSVSAASEWAALHAGYHHKINPQVSSSLTNCSSERKCECYWQKLLLITLLGSWPKLSLSCAETQTDVLHPIKVCKWKFQIYRCIIWPPIVGISSVLNFIRTVYTASAHWETRFCDPELQNATAQNGLWSRVMDAHFIPNRPSSIKVTTRGVKW